MKKMFVLILTLAMLMSAMAAIAEDGQGGPMGGQPPTMGDSGPQNGQQPPEKPSGDQGQQPPEKPSGDQGQQPPEKPSGDQGQQAPQKGEQKWHEQPAETGDDQGQQHAQTGDRKQRPGMVDFDAMVTKGVISQETRDNIKAYMDEHKPEGAPAEGQTSTDGQTPPEKPEGVGGGLLADLLDAGIITQAEYDAMIAAQIAA